MKITRNTQQKRIIMQALMNADHPTASDLYRKIHGDYPNISRATVFRVLSQFAESGEAVRINLFDGPARFDACLKPHAHVQCINCGKVFDVYGIEPEGLLKLNRVDGFDILYAKIEFAAVCNDCKNKPN